MYLAGVPAQDQVMVPVLVLAVGVTVRVTAWPVEVLAVLPVTTIAGKRAPKKGGDGPGRPG